MPETNFDNIYSGRGIRNQSSPQDSGAVAKTSSPATLTVTVPANSDGTQPTVDHGQVMLSLTSLNASAVFAGGDVYASDGSKTEYLGTFPPTIGGVAGQGATFVMEVFSALVNITNIVTLTVSITSTGNNNLTAELRFNYGV
jgi:hypothetical protein